MVDWGDRQEQAQTHGQEQGAMASSGVASTSGAREIPYDLRSSSSLRRFAPEPASESNDSLSLPTAPRFWLRPGPGYTLVTNIAVAHGAAGLFGAAAGALIWYFLAPMALLPVVAAVAGLFVAVAGAVSFELSRGANASVVWAARLLLPLADLLACGAALWLLGEREFIVLLFVVPSCVATLLLSWRSGAIFALVSVLVYGGVSIAQDSAAPDLWAPRTLALAGILSLVTFCIGVFTQQMSEIIARQQQQLTHLAEQHDIQIREQQRLLEGLNLLEETQMRLERERAWINQQIVEVAGAARKLSEGDLGGARGLRPGMYGPLDILAGALVRLGHQMAVMLGLRQQIAGQEQALATLITALREQARLATATDSELRALGIGANELVAEVQRLERGSGELPGLERHMLFQALREVERRAMAQASNTAMLGARLAQLRARQRAMAAEIERSHEAPTTSDILDGARSDDTIPSLPSLRPGQL